MPETVLVTGAGGFVARVLVPHLEQRGFRVLTHRRVDGDLSVAPPTQPPSSWVVHLAGRSFVPESWNDPSRFYRDNTVTTMHVLEYCRSSGARMLYVSSYVYGKPDQLPIPETHPVKAVNPYAHSKILGEELVRFYTATLGVVSTIVRPFNLYGPGQDARFIIPSIVRQAITPASTEIVVDDLRPRRDFLHVTDFVSLLGTLLSVGRPGTYNAGSGASISIGELVDLIRALVPTTKPIREVGHARVHEIPDVVADVSRAATELNWQPQISLEQGLRETIASAVRSLQTQ